MCIRDRQINPATPRREAFANSYLYYQNKRSIRDFEIALVPDSTRRFGVLEPVSYTHLKK